MRTKGKGKSGADLEFATDPRWASTNLGCFMCIRCSGIHRGMGVHITRSESIEMARGRELTI